MRAIRLVHVADLHFGHDAELDQVEAIEALLPTLEPTAVVIAGDLSQRARHGELQHALAFARTMARVAPTLCVGGNHDVQWWRSPFGLLGARVKYGKYRRYFGPDLRPVLELPGLCIASVLTSYGVAFGSMTWNLRDVAVKGHLPKAETERVKALFAERAPGVVRCVAIHHNVLRGQISQRMGLARWRTAQRRLVGTGADLVLCGHDHQEGAGEIDGVLPVSTAGTHTSRTRGHRPAAFNLVTVDESSVAVQHLRWDRGAGTFVRADQSHFARRRPAPVST